MVEAERVCFFGSFFLAFPGFPRENSSFLVLEGFGVIFLGFPSKKHVLVLDFPAEKHVKGRKEGKKETEGRKEGSKEGKKRRKRGDVYQYIKYMYIYIYNVHSI